MSQGHGTKQAPPFSLNRLKADANNTIDQVIGSPGHRDETGVTGRWYKSARDSVQSWGKLHDPVVNPITGQKRSPTSGEVAARVLRNVQRSVGAVLNTLSVPQDMLNVGFATLTSSLAQAYGQMPASTLLELYISTPHYHAPPVAGPVPLPAIGVVVLGVHLRTLINGMPAARVGDFGFSPTCGSKTPWFEIFLGSSNVFIGGKRAARLNDIAICCKPGGGALEGFGLVMAVAGFAAGELGVAADLAEAAVEDDAAMASAKALSAAMNSAQMAMDVAAMAVAMIPKDPGAPPGIGPLLIGHSTVLIGGFPMINIPDPVSAILNKLKTLRARKGKEPDHHGPCATEEAPINLVTGAFIDFFRDIELPGPLPFLWKRYYDSRWASTPGPLGFGYRHDYQWELRPTLDGLTLITPAHSRWTCLIVN